MENNTHRTWAEIDLGAIEHNFKEIRAHVDGAKVLCVIKANAYGHGSGPVAKRLQAVGADYFGVATVPEAVGLREQGISLPILILGYIDEADAPLIARYGITAAVYDADTAEMLSRAAMREGRKITVHFKIDTGMGRLGFPARSHETVAREILKIAKMPGLIPDGAFTHFAVADELQGDAYTARQFAQFSAVCDTLEAGGLPLNIRHCANSGAILQHPCSRMDMVRAGIILYGFYPDESLPRTLELRPAMTLKAHVVQVKTMESGNTISYGRQYRVSRRTRVAVLSIGYADGYLRSASGRAQVMLGGCIVPVVGRICMDMCMAELPDGLEVRRGDEAVIYGASGVTAATAATAAGTICYEALCAVSSRVPRIYLD